jgi:hypothetical protein
MRCRDDLWVSVDTGSCLESLHGGISSTAHMPCLTIFHAWHHVHGLTSPCKWAALPPTLIYFKRLRQRTVGLMRKPLSCWHTRA